MTSTTPRAAAALSCILAAGGAAFATDDDPAAARPVALRIDPAEIDLSASDDAQSFVVQAEYRDGTTEDVTGEASLLLSDPFVAALDGSVVRPRHDGSAELRAYLLGRSAGARVTVRGASEETAPSFRLDVIPALTAAGCNSGACHGSARGQDGFSLSLFGFDPARDYHRITRELGARRINLALPSDSLLLRKGLGEVPHTGGKLFERDDPICRAITRWIEAGAPDDEPDVARPIALDLDPPRAVLRGAGATQRLVARARYSDGTDRDVTHLSRFLTTDDGCAAVDRSGVVTGGRPGEAFVTARFHTFTVGVPVIVRDPARPYRGGPTRGRNYIDDLVLDKLRRLRIEPAPVCDDETFLRRVFLDLIGRLPTPADRARFLEDAGADKRDRLIDELIERKEFAELWVMKWSEILQIRTDPPRGLSYKAMVLYSAWLREKIAQNTPLDRMARELLTATGGTFRNPATNFYQVERDTLKLAENVTQSLLGMRIQCAQCHNHPFDRWTMDDYYGFAAFFSQIGRKRAADPRETVVFDSRSGSVKHPVTGQDVAPRFLGGDAPDVRGKDRRAVLADWLVSKENPYFARNLANRIFAHFMGRGIVEPVDDFRVTNPPSNARLLDALADRLVETDFDLRRLVRDICRSDTYQRASVADDSNRDDDRNFSKAAVRRLQAEILLDAIAQVTETKNKFKGLPLGARAVEITDGAITNDFLTTFGRATRQTVCACEVKVEPNLSQALHLINGDTVHRRIQQGGVVARLLDQGGTWEAIVRELYVRCLAREPTGEELAAVSELLAGDEDRTREVLEDVFWALLNSREFLFNH